MMESSGTESINIEVVLQKARNIRQDEDLIKHYCLELFKNRPVSTGSIITTFDESSLYLSNHVKSIIVGEHTRYINEIDFSRVNIKWFIYSLNKEDVKLEVDQDNEGEEVNLATIQMLPCLEYCNLWESLIYDIQIKEKLLRYASSALFFADRNINSNINNCNRVVLLHGPPGTGKTSLCKALAQKLTIRLGHRFNKGVLLEINSHSLFSKWFSESGKLVNKIFSRIRDFLNVPNTLIFVLIDEVESLTHAREQCMSGNEPSDSVRVVNAILTEIDKIKNHPNVLILTTSNMTSAIDLAFIDRVDISQFIGLPSVEAIYQIFYSCLEDLMKGQVISPKALFSPNCRTLLNVAPLNAGSRELSEKLLLLSKISVGLSGRALRKIPLYAHTYLQNDVATIEEFLEAMALAINDLKVDRANINKTLI